MAFPMRLSLNRLSHLAYNRVYLHPPVPTIGIFWPAWRPTASAPAFLVFRGPPRFDFTDSLQINVGLRSTLVCGVHLFPWIETFTFPILLAETFAPRWLTFFGRYILIFDAFILIPRVSAFFVPSQYAVLLAQINGNLRILSFYELKPPLFDLTFSVAGLFLSIVGISHLVKVLAANFSLTLELST